jgi:hypothetical protein
MQCVLVEPHQPYIHAMLVTAWYETVYAVQREQRARMLPACLDHACETVFCAAYRASLSRRGEYQYWFAFAIPSRFKAATRCRVECTMPLSLPIHVSGAEIGRPRKP